MITNLEIKNFKAIKQLDIPIGNITLFSGLNAVGKSSAIQALLLLRQSLKEDGFRKGLFLKSEDYLSLGVGKDVFSIAAGLDETLDIALEWDFSQLVEWHFKYSKDKDILPLEKLSGDIPADWASKAIFSPHFQYLSANRINPQVQYKTSPYYVDELASLGKEGEYTVHYLARHQDSPIKNKTLQHPQAKSDTLLDNVDAWLSGISPGVKVAATYHEELESASLSYSFEMPHGYTGNFKPTNVGFGLTYVLPIIVALLMLPDNGMLIVENPESHLHPAGQSKVAQLCALAATAGVQVVLESHSDHVFNGLRVAVRKNQLSHEDILVYYFHRDANSPDHATLVEPVYIYENGRADKWPDGFFDEWDKQLDELTS